MSSMVLLNEVGDITISWDDEQNEVMRKLIQTKIDEGYTFFVLKRRGIVWKSVEKIKNVKDLSENKIRLFDADFEKLLNNGKITLLKNTDNDFSVERKASSADDAAKNDTVATKPIRGG